MGEKKRVGRPTDYRPEYCEHLVEHMKEGGSFPAFAGVVGVSIQTVYDWTENNAEFLEAKKRGEAANLLFFENIALGGITGQMRRLVKKIPMTTKNAKGESIPMVDPITKKVLYHEEYAASPFNALGWMFIAQNRFKDQYRNVRNIALSGDGMGSAIKIKSAEPTADEKLREIKEVQEILRTIDHANKLIGSPSEFGADEQMDVIPEEGKE